MQASTSSQIDIQKIINAAHLILSCVRNYNSEIPIRVFGSTALALTCPNHTYLWQKTNRKPIRDIDFVTLPQYREQIRKALIACGAIEYEGSMITNVQYQRLYFHLNNPPLLLEIHSAPLIFHHKIPFDKDLSSDPDTLTLADLAITKLQWSALKKNTVQTDLAILETEKEQLIKKGYNEDKFKINDIDGKLKLYADNTAQLIDLCVLLAEYPVVTDSKTRGIHIDRFLALARRDWGLWVTLRRNLKALEKFIPRMFAQDEYASLRDIVLGRTASLRAALATLHATTLKWKVDSVVHCVICERCYPIGYPVEEPQRDVWR